MKRGALIRRVFLASLLQRPLASLLSLVAIALGVALGLAVQLIQAAAVDEFGRGMRQLSGAADLQVVGPRGGFDENVYLTLARHPDVAAASPVLEIEAHLPGRGERLAIHGIDLFRAAAVAPALLPGSGAGSAGADGERFALLNPDALYLTPAARTRLDLGGDVMLVVQSGLDHHVLEVRGTLPAASGHDFGVMDIASAQQLFERIGRISRIDLRLGSGVALDAARERIASTLPAGVKVATPEAVVDQTTGLSRAYRVNMAMLAAIALLCGGLLVFSAQLLSVVRRRQELAFLRALGLERGALFRALLLEGAVVGLIGAVLGVVFAYALTWAAFSLVGGDLGAGYFRGVAPELVFRPGLLAAYVAFGVLAGVCGACLPARDAARLQPARALRGGDELALFRMRARGFPVLLGLALAAALCFVPPVDGIPVGGYVAVALVLASAVLAMPLIVSALGWVLARREPLLLRLAHARLAAAPGQAVVAGAGVVASVALAVAMAIMVSSFRASVDDWLARMLPADLYARASSSLASGYLDAPEVARIAALAGVADARAVRFDSVRLDERRHPATLIARDVDGGNLLPLVAEGQVSADVPPVWISEALADLYAVNVGDELALPLAGDTHPFEVVGVWRDYARQHGAAVIELETYRHLTGDSWSNDVAITLVPGVGADEVAHAITALFADGRIEITRPGEIREASLALFDRTFFVTYLMEAVAVLIGLFGICTTFAALAVSRRKEFGMLRHLGLERRRIGRLLALEGGLTAVVGVSAGMLGGGVIAVILIEVVNRQSFHWSMDMHVPGGVLAGFAIALTVAAGAAARLAGRSAMQSEAALAVREDW